MTRRALAPLLILLTFVAGCGGSKESGPSSSAPQQQSQEQASPGLVIDVDVRGGNVTPTNGEFKAKIHETIQLRVDSDVADELHVHSVPDHTFPVEAKQGQMFQFTVDVPGRVEVELHKLDRTVATIQVQQ
ncbi:MAG: hypothetical protein ACM4D3_23195 [Candidatus Sericytochromatia bacterium]